MDWFKLHHDLPHTSRYGQLNDTQRAIYLEILCAASARSCDDDRGVVMVGGLAWSLRRNANQVLAACKRLASVGLIEYSPPDTGGTIEVLGWDRHQRKSADSKARVRKHRESKDSEEQCNVTETLPKRDGNALEKRRTDTEEKREEHTKTRVCAREDVTAVIQFWKQSWNKPDYRDNMAEQITVSNALRQGWTVDQLKDCIAGYRNDKWPKRKQYSGLTYLLKDGDAIQGGIDLVETKAPETPDGGYEAWAEKVKDEVIAGDGEIDWDAPPWSRSRWESESVGREG